MAMTKFFVGRFSLVISGENKCPFKLNFSNSYGQVVEYPKMLQDEEKYDVNSLAKPPVPMTMTSSVLFFIIF